MRKLLSYFQNIKEYRDLPFWFLFAFALSLGFGIYHYHGSWHDPDTYAYLSQAKIFASGDIKLSASPIEGLIPSNSMTLDQGYWFSKFTPGNSLALVIFVYLRIVWLFGPLLHLITLLVSFLFFHHYFKNTHITAWVMRFLSILPIGIHISSTLMSENLSLLLNVIALYYFQKHHEASDSDRKKNLILSGFAFGISILVRPANALITILSSLFLYPFKLSPRHMFSYMIPIIIFVGFLAKWNDTITQNIFEFSNHYKHENDFLGFGPRNGNDNNLNSQTYFQHTPEWAIKRLTQFIMPSISYSAFAFPFWSPTSFIDIPNISQNTKYYVTNKNQYPEPLLKNKQYWSFGVQVDKWRTTSLFYQYVLNNITYTEKRYLSRTSNTFDFYLNLDFKENQSSINFVNKINRFNYSQLLPSQMNDSLRLRIESSHLFSELYFNTLNLDKSKNPFYFVGLYNYQNNFNPLKSIQSIHSDPAWLSKNYVETQIHNNTNSQLYNFLHFSDLEQKFQQLRWFYLLPWFIIILGLLHTPYVRFVTVYSGITIIYYSLFAFDSSLYIENPLASRYYYELIFLILVPLFAIGLIRYFKINMVRITFALMTISSLYLYFKFNSESIKELNLLKTQTSQINENSVIFMANKLGVVPTDIDDYLSQQEPRVLYYRLRDYEYTLPIKNADLLALYNRYFQNRKAYIWNGSQLIHLTFN